MEDETKVQDPTTEETVDQVENQDDLDLDNSPDEDLDPEDMTDDLGLLDDDGAMKPDRLRSEEDYEDDDEGEDEPEPEEEPEPEAEADPEPEPEEDNPEPEPEPEPVVETQAEKTSKLEDQRQINAKARQLFEQREGVAYDEFDDDHRDVIAEIKAEIKAEINENKRREIERQNLQRRYAEGSKKLAVIIEANGGQEFFDFVKSYTMDELPARKYLEIQEAENIKGDFTKSIELVKELAARFKGEAPPAKPASQAALTQARAKAKRLKQNPPRTIRPGGGSETPKAASDVFGLDEFGMSDEDLG